jgi:hypothetical protein
MRFFYLDLPLVTFQSKNRLIIRDLLLSNGIRVVLAFNDDDSPQNGYLYVYPTAGSGHSLLTTFKIKGIAIIPELYIIEVSTNTIAVITKTREGSSFFLQIYITSFFDSFDITTQDSTLFLIMDPLIISRKISYITKLHVSLLKEGLIAISQYNTINEILTILFLEINVISNTFKFNPTSFDVKTCDTKFYAMTLGDLTLSNEIKIIYACSNDRGVYINTCIPQLPTKRLECFGEKKLNNNVGYIGEGYFDINNHIYLPIVSSCPSVINTYDINLDNTFSTYPVADDLSWSYTAYSAGIGDSFSIIISGQSGDINAVSLYNLGGTPQLYTTIKTGLSWPYQVDDCATYRVFCTMDYIASRRPYAATIISIDVSQTDYNADMHLLTLQLKFFKSRFLLNYKNITSTFGGLFMLTSPMLGINKDAWGGLVRMFLGVHSNTYYANRISFVTDPSPMFWFKSSSKKVIYNQNAYNAYNDLPSFIYQNSPTINPGVSKIGVLLAGWGIQGLTGTYCCHEGTFNSINYNDAKMCISPLGKTEIDLCQNKQPSSRYLPIFMDVIYNLLLSAPELVHSYRGVTYVGLGATSKYVRYQNNVWDGLRMIAKQNYQITDANLIIAKNLLQFNIDNIAKEKINNCLSRMSSAILELTNSNNNLLTVSYVPIICKNSVARTLGNGYNFKAQHGTWYMILCEKSQNDPSNSENIQLYKASIQEQPRTFIRGQSHTLFHELTHAVCDTTDRPVGGAEDQRQDVYGFERCINNAQRTSISDESIIIADCLTLFVECLNSPQVGGDWCTSSQALKHNLNTQDRGGNFMIDNNILFQGIVTCIGRTCAMTIQLFNNGPIPYYYPCSMLLQGNGMPREYYIEGPSRVICLRHDLDMELRGDCFINSNSNVTIVEHISQRCDLVHITEGSYNVVFQGMLPLYDSINSDVPIGYANRNASIPFTLLDKAVDTNTFIPGRGHFCDHIEEF